MLHNKHNPKTHKNILVRLLDSSIYVISFIAPISTLPQIVQVWRFHQTTGVSVSTWAAFAGINLLWIFYGSVHKARPITFGNALMFLCNGAVALGVLINH